MSELTIEKLAKDVFDFKKKYGEFPSEIELSPEEVMDLIELTTDITPSRISFEGGERLITFMGIPVKVVDNDNP